MKTLQTTINSDINAIKNLIEEYHQLEDKMKGLDALKQNNEWSDLYEKQKSVAAQIRRCIRHLAGYLGFSLGKDFREYKYYVPSYEKAFKRIIYHWNQAQALLHELSYCDKDLLENNESATYNEND